MRRSSLALPELEIQFSDHMVDLVREGVDLAICLGPLLDSATEVAKPRGVQQAMLCASPAYLAQHGSLQALANLSRHSFQLHHVTPGETARATWRGCWGGSEILVFVGRKDLARTRQHHHLQPPAMPIHGLAQAVEMALGHAQAA
ncbi:LysR substrate binding domain-containing protein [Duganella sacchari]|uniref:LysR substrate binding domain-containing protein n=1 Tax=Duganella sacchari TaxID=551987 RepID=A0A1M7R4E7_9BURK|nr:LysR substrate binding domain-containing protein [Duganella sacchari]